MKRRSSVKMNAFGAKMMATPGSKVATNFKGSRKVEKKGIQCVTRIAMKRCLQCEECRVVARAEIVIADLYAGLPFVKIV